ncbi:MAG: type IV pilus secretin PilQ [Deltaproteobacteria bacterium]|nr:type IV pilus secretin PilQ [Deltaproteobacteria bacterium]
MSPLVLARRLTLVLLGVAPAVANAGPLNQVSKVVVSERGDNTVVELRGTTRALFSVFKLERPPRLTVDLANSALVGVSNLVDVDTWAVSQIATTQFRSDASTIARVMINFRRACHYTVRTDGERVVVTVVPHKGRPPSAMGASQADLNQARQAAAQAGQQAAQAQASAAQAQANAAQAQANAAQAQAKALQARGEAERARKDAERERTARGQKELALEQARKEITEQARAALAAQAAVEREKQSLERARREAEARQAEARRLRGELAEARGRAEQAPAAIAAAKRLIAEKAAAVAQAEARAQQALAARRAVERVVDRAEKKLKDAEAARLKAEGARAEADLARQKAESDRARAQQARLKAETEREKARAEAETLRRQAEVARAEVQSARAEGAVERARAAKLRKEVESARKAAELARKAADRTRAEAEATQAKAEQRATELAAEAAKERRRAEAARAQAEERAGALERSEAEVKARKAKVAEALATAKRLKAALAAALEREDAQAKAVAKARAEAEAARVASRGADAARKELDEGLAAAKARQVRLNAQIAGLTRELGEQRQRATLATSRLGELRRVAEAARAKVAAEREQAQKARAVAELKEAEGRLRSAEAAQKKADLAQARLAAEARRADAKRAEVAQAVAQGANRLALAERQAAQSVERARTAESQLRKSQTLLAEVKALRAQEEEKRQGVEQARRGELERLGRAEIERRKAERARGEAETALRRTQAELARMKSARVAEERQLERLERAKQAAAKQLAEVELKKARRVAALAARLGPAKGRAAVAFAAAGSAEAGAAAAARTPESRIRDIRFVDRPNGARVVIELDGEAQHQIQRGDGDLVLYLRGAKLPRLLQRTLDASEFKGPVRSVSSYVDPSASGTVQIKVAVAGAPRQRLERKGRLLVWDFDAGVPAPRPEGQASAAAATVQPLELESEKVAGVRARGPAGGGRRSYSGRRIDLDFKDADIHNILRLLSDVGNVNIITSDAVRGSVTIRMKNVPWDQALDVILRAKGLGQVREGNLLRVAPIQDLEKERESEIARQKQVLLLQPLETRLLPLSYAQASAVLPQLQYTMSPRGRLTFDERTNTIIARDIASNLNLVERMIRNLDTQTPQVMIEARIVEARTNFTRAFGIQWGGAFTASNATGNSTGLAFPNQIGVGGGTDDPNAPTRGILLGQAANPNFLVNMPAATGVGSGAAVGLTLGSINGAFNLNLRLSAAENSGDIRIISAPRITTLDNVEAHIEQGVTIPFSQITAVGVQTTFRDAKLNLTVKPHVTADGSIIMSVNVTRNEPDFVNTGPRGDPTILKKEAKTEMLVKDGDTAVIGGIYTTRDGRSWAKVPWFAEIPILGWLFKTRRESSDREEVLVFITPRIINRAQSIGGR